MTRFVFYQKLPGSCEEVKWERRGCCRGPCSVFIPGDREEGAGESPPDPNP